MHPSLPCGHTRLRENCPSCITLITEWYDKLRLTGFEDAECLHRRRLKEWTGISDRVVFADTGDAVGIMDLVSAQAPHTEPQSSFPQSWVSDPERLLCHPEFERLCASICSHGRHTLSTEQVRAIWVLHTEGTPKRAISRLLGINDTITWRTIDSMSQHMALIDLDEEEPPQPLVKVVLREFEPHRDAALIYASWRNAIWYDDETRRESDSDRFFKQATASIRNILENANTKVRIACLSDNVDHIVGYSVVTGLCLHFVYVKADYRGKRIGSLLVPKNIESVSPVLTKIGRAIAIKKKFIKEPKNILVEFIEAIKNTPLKNTENI